MSTTSEQPLKTSSKRSFFFFDYTFQPGNKFETISTPWPMGARRTGLYWGEWSGGRAMFGKIRLSPAFANLPLKARVSQGFSTAEAKRSAAD